MIHIISFSDRVCHIIRFVNSTKKNTPQIGRSAGYSRYHVAVINDRIKKQPV